jgi:thiol-disulfide isomerase/thioredoxin
MQNDRSFFLLLALLVSACVQAADQRPLPDFTTADPADWFNSEPLSVQRLRGKVILVDVWTFDCWNCYRSFPWLKDLEARFTEQPFQVIGIHSPEFKHERDPAQVAASIRKFDLEHPVMMDNDFGYWRALDNRYWPAYYLVDKQGTIRHVHVGETHVGDARARRIEEQIRSLLVE